MPEWVHDPDEVPPDPSPDIKDFQCPRCGAQIRHIPEDRETAYLEAAKEHIAIFEKEFWSTIEDLDEMFPDTPVIEYLEERSRKLKRAIKLLKKSFDDGLTLEESCELDNIMDKF